MNYTHGINKNWLENFWAGDKNQKGINKSVRIDNQGSCVEVWNVLVFPPAWIWGFKSAKIRLFYFLRAADCVCVSMHECVVCMYALESVSLFFSCYNL